MNLNKVRGVYKYFIIQTIKIAKIKKSIKAHEKLKHKYIKMGKAITTPNNSAWRFELYDFLVYQQNIA